MGSLRAIEMAEAVREGVITRRQALEDHLRYNHFPPVPSVMVAVAERALDKCDRGEFTARVRLPAGVTHRKYGRLVPVGVVVASLHLDEFLS